ncbi:MAG: PEGA domain-containing protein [Deltaproteobacteria bacterium]|nr:PEGA domain-containing protein [Deltaproteobacteria bacterium]
MKNPLICFLLLFFIIFSLSCGQQGDRTPSSGGTASTTTPAAPTTPTFGRLSIQSWGVQMAKVYVDDIYQGTTSLTLDHVPSGTHAIKVTKWGLNDVLITKNIQKDQETHVDILFPDILTGNPNSGGLIVDELSPPAQIFLDGTYLGQTPYKNLQLVPSENKLLRLQRGTEEVLYQYISISQGYINYIQPQLKDTTTSSILPLAKEITVSYSCPTTNQGSSIQYRGITLACFDDEKKNIMRDTLDFIYLDQNTYRYPVQFSTWLPWMSAQLIQGYSPAIQSTARNPQDISTFEGQHPLSPGTTQLYDNAFTNAFSGHYMLGSATGILSGLLIHEALHGLNLAHQGCSASDPSDDWQDPNAGGIYGTQARRNAKLASLDKHPWLDNCIDRKFLYIVAESLIQNSICNLNQRIDLRTEFLYPACSVPTHFRDPDTNQMMMEYLQYRSTP